MSTIFYPLADADKLLSPLLSPVLLSLVISIRLCMVEALHCVSSLKLAVQRSNLCKWNDERRWH
jgi:hypothetical protein